MSSETQEARLADLPEAFRPEMLATLEKQCRDFFTWVVFLWFSAMSNMSIDTLRSAWSASRDKR